LHEGIDTHLPVFLTTCVWQPTKRRKNADVKTPGHNVFAPFALETAFSKRREKRNFPPGCPVQT
jgi:hypothetical protein